MAGRGWSWGMVAALSIAAVFLTRSPFRSEFLFSWDSANYALAMERIDIAEHRPHPPGYLGYVAVARGLAPFTADANGALVLWNIIVTALAAFVLVRFAHEANAGNRPLLLAAVATIVVTSPLLWFYSEIAEIYPSELLVTLLVGFAAWRVTRGDAKAIYLCAASLAIAAVFKLSAALLMAPLAVYAWWRVPNAHRAWSALVLTVFGIIVAGIFLATQPDLPSLVQEQFLSSTAGSRVVIEPQRPSLLRGVNRGLRSTVLALVTAVGPLNAIAMIWWLARDRRSAPLGFPVAVLWAVPWLLVFVLIHIAKPGYVLPLLPVAVLLLAGMYSRLPTRIAAILIAAQAAINVILFVALQPFPGTWTGGPIRYSSKSFLQRAASDLQAVTYPTAFTIAESERNVRTLLNHVRERCPASAPLIVAGTDPVDWRRVMWYLPRATAVHVADGRVQFIARAGEVENVASEGVSVHTTCQGLWLARDERSTEVPLPSRVERVDGLGFALPAGEARISPGGIVVR